MKIVINHLTRMKPGYVCVAGIRVSPRSHIRPVTPGGRLPVAMAEGLGGPFSIRGVVELGEVRGCGTPPLVEDVEFHPHQAKRIGLLKHAEFWKLLNDTAETSFKTIFGDDLEQIGNGLAMLPNRGAASLGCLLPVGSLDLSVNDFGKIRLHLDDAEGRYDLSVTDLRLYNPEDYSLNLVAIGDVQHKLRNGTPSVLSVGLTRLWAKPGDAQDRHWLQVNGIHLESD